LESPANQFDKRTHGHMTNNLCKFAIDSQSFLANNIFKWY